MRSEAIHEGGSGLPCSYTIYSPYSLRGSNSAIFIFAYFLKSSQLLSREEFTALREKLFS